MKYLDIALIGQEITLEPPLVRTPTKHVFDKDMVHAVNAALAAQRPLLVRGEPGIGKSQLARAVAQTLGWGFVSTVVDLRTEPRDLLWTFDAVRRLADAQVRRAEHVPDDALIEARYICPGPIWWAFDWASAAEQAERSRSAIPPRPADAKGAVVLIDEIDKADTSVPNGLLQALGDGRIDVLGRPEPIMAQALHPPLVVVTTNEDRALPDAFLRRCMVLQLRVGTDLTRWLIERGRAHFPELSSDLREQAAQMLAEDRVGIVRRGLSPPGQAEYLDILRALETLCETDAERIDMLGVIRKYTFDKHPPERDRRGSSR